MEKLEPGSIKQVTAVSKLHINKDKYILLIGFKDVYDEKHEGYLTNDLKITNIGEKNLMNLDADVKKFSTIQESDIYVTKLKDLISWRENEDDFILLTVKFKLDPKFNIDEITSKLDTVGAKVVQIGQPNDDSILTAIDEARQFRDRLLTIQNIIDSE